MGPWDPVSHGNRWGQLRRGMCSACRSSLILTASNWPVHVSLVIVLFLHSKFYVMFLPTHIPISSEPTKASSGGPCVLSNIEENMCLRVRVFLLLHMQNARVCTERLQPSGLPHLSYRPVGTWAYSPHLRPRVLGLCTGATLSISNTFHVHHLT